MSLRVTAKRLVVEYLLLLRQQKAVADLDNLDIAIDSLRDCFELKDVKHGTDALERALAGERAQLDNVTSEEYKDRGNKAFKEGNFKEAVTLFTQALEIAGANNESSEVRAIYYANRAAARVNLDTEKDIDDAIDDCEQAVSLSPGYHKAWFRLGGIQERRGKKHEAFRAYSEARKHDPSNPKYEEAYERVREKDVGASSGIPGGPGGPDMSALMNNPLFQQLKDDPDILELMKNPKVGQLMSQVSTNPMAALGAMSDPELGPIFQKIMAKLGPKLGEMLGGLGGMFGGAGGSAGAPPAGMFS
ncbi:Small glutamine-rich tetratricopeptide repeat-containing protein [Giardia muris]|uniref:Small glutamine-rich tetratricopeptide repeat-containing protein n=1 Tax=Giardia muris TaxID=5742 RepID=A0A4Z1SL69_GIAMU|nr:Small glutamine-rich tetratricopeptide repeat-containing protein [Giardia muris]|eukprot:TNJ26374.1 Small glutamine-rich tetratricopeptide repeat-containing protein [Giardia muris]